MGVACKCDLIYNEKEDNKIYSKEQETSLEHGGDTNNHGATERDLPMN